MGIISGVACKDCEVARNLDKIQFFRDIDNLSDAIELGNYLKRKEVLVREAMLLSFLQEHKGCNVIFYDDYSDHFDVPDSYQVQDFWED